MIQDLLLPETELRETHASWVLLGPRYVHKIKKPVQFPFLDYSALVARRRACEAEVLLNSRLAPLVYLGAEPVVLREGRHFIGNEGGTERGKAGRVVDWAVTMLRLPDELRADNLLRDEKLGIQEVRQLADVLARFHEDQGTSEPLKRFASAERVRSMVEANVSEAEVAARRSATRRTLRELRRSQLGRAESGSAEFEERLRSGRIRDGHGDLRLEHVYFLGSPEGIAILDCIEFDEALRVSDVASDIAFLSMDFRLHDRPIHAESLLARYAREAEDFDLYRVIDFYESYRATVRGKIELLRGQDAPARRYFQLALQSLAREEPGNWLIAVGGGIATGKSTTADAIQQQLGMAVIESDRTRKWMLGLSPATPVRADAWTGAYDEATTRRVYEECFRRASAVLRSGRSAVIDASFRARDARARARELARSHGARFLFIECRAHPDICRERLVERARSGSVSDGRLEILNSFSAAFEAVTELPANEHWLIDTAMPLPDFSRLGTHIASQTYRRPA